MCGIAGVVGAPADIPTLLRVLQHRGPDDQGYLVFSNEGVRLGREWNGRHYVVYNGEIYNYLELKLEPRVKRARD